MLPSQTPVHTNTQAFCKKSNGMVNNSATFSFLHLNKSYLYNLSEEAFTEHYLFKDTPLDHSIFKAWSFVCKKNLEKNPKTHNKKPTILLLWLGTQQAKLHVREASFRSANPVVLFPSFSVIPQTLPAPLLQQVHVTYLQLHFKTSLFAIKLNILSKGQKLFLK